jgi:ribosomal-protein-alanine N-acetyltransferase
MSKLIEALIEAGASRVLLEVRESNKSAINLYKKLGFEVIGEVERYYSNGEKAIVMAKELGSSS